MIKRRLMLLLGVMGLLAQMADAQSGAGLDLSWCTMDAAGSCQTGGQYILIPLAGQPDPGALAGDTFNLAGGLLPECDPVLKIIALTPANSWQTGATVQIHWWSDVSVAGPTVRLELWRGAQRQATLANDTNTSGDHVCRLTLPSVSGGPDCRIRAVSTRLEALSNPNPYIESGTLNVLGKPNATEPRTWALYDY